MVAAINRSPVYKGFVRYGGMLYPGKHEAIVHEETWEEANKAIGDGREDDTGLYYTDPPTSTCSRASYAAAPAAGR